MALGPEQSYLAQKIIAGESMVVSGPGGVGKSHLGRSIIKHFGSQIVVCAPTGEAAAILGGFTIHSLFGLTPVDNAKGDVKCNKIWKLKHLLTSHSTKILLIDEIFMVSRDLFEVLDVRLRELRRQKDVAFGGLQLLCIGDPLQLPPIKRNGTVQFCFQSPIFKQIIGGNQFRLRQQYRQTSDPTFSDILAQVRIGKASSEALMRINTRIAPSLRYEDYLSRTTLFPFRRDAENHNARCMDQLGGPVTEWKAVDIVNSDGTEAMLGTIMLEPCLTLKVGALVFCTTNFPEHSLVNGSRGRVIAIRSVCSFGRPGICGGICDFCSGATYPEDNGSLKMIGTFAPPNSPYGSYLPIVEFTGGIRFIVGWVTLSKTRVVWTDPTPPSVLPANNTNKRELKEFFTPPKKTPRVELSSELLTTLLAPPDPHQSAYDRQLAQHNAINEWRSQTVATRRNFVDLADENDEEHGDVVESLSASKKSRKNLGTRRRTIEMPPIAEAAVAASSSSSSSVASSSSSNNSRVYYSGPDTGESEVVLVSRTAIPLRIAWGVTIHKSQGATYDEITFKANTFCAGQFYVALSRCKTLNGVTILGERVSPSRIFADQVAVEYEKKLSNILLP